MTIFNREAQRMTGYTLEEVSAFPLRAGLPLEQSPLAPLGVGMLEVLNSPGEVKESVAQILKKDRTLLPVSYRINQLVEGPEMLGATAVFMEQKEAVREPARREDIDYQLLLRSLGSRIERLYAHPLSRVIEHVRMMDLDAWARSRDEVVRVLEVGSGALTGLLEDVEQYLNCVTSREWDEPCDCDLGSMVDEIVDGVLRQPYAQGVVVAVNLSTLPPAFGYERMVRSALEKVLENACAAAAGGGRRVEVVGHAGNGVVRVEVRDTGPGVPVDVRESIYNPFFTSREGHSGLGLAIAARVMRRLGGRVGLADSDKGALFFLEFPASPAPGSTDEQAGPEGGPGEQAGSEGG